MATTPESVKKSLQTYAVLWRPGASLPEGATAADLAMARMSLETAHKELARIKVQCHDCSNYDIDSCALHGTVPEDFKKTEGACDDWRFDGIPW
jgi:hypothetical protein